jgi:hypothetical protein
VLLLLLLIEEDGGDERMDRERRVEEVPEDCRLALAAVRDVSMMMIDVAFRIL